VLGSPIAHSLSPVLHAAAYDALGFTDWTYEAIECDEARLPGFVASLGPEWAGLSLTMPLKRAVLPLLDRADALVMQVGAANTVVLDGGVKAGFNTDVPGMVAALGSASAAADGPVLILGAGATACSALAALAQAGVGSVTVAVRDPARAGELLAVAGRVGVTVTLAPFKPAPFGPGLARQAWGLLISTVPAGAADGYASLLADGSVVAAAIFDVLYDPWPTRLADAAIKRGIAVIGGFDLLLRQAAAQVVLMTGRPAPVEAMRRAGLAALAARYGPRA
jgi:shikimate dehydrogenase